MTDKTIRFDPHYITLPGETIPGWVILRKEDDRGEEVPPFAREALLREGARKRHLSRVGEVLRHAMWLSALADDPPRGQKGAFEVVVKPHDAEFLRVALTAALEGCGGIHGIGACESAISTARPSWLRVPKKQSEHGEAWDAAIEHAASIMGDLGGGYGLFEPQVVRRLIFAVEIPEDLDFVVAFCLRRSYEAAKDGLEERYQASCATLDATRDDASRRAGEFFGLAARWESAARWALEATAPGDWWDWDDVALAGDRHKGVCAAWARRGLDWVCDGPTGPLWAQVEGEAPGDPEREDVTWSSAYGHLARDVEAASRSSFADAGRGIVVADMLRDYGPRTALELLQGRGGAPEHLQPFVPSLEALIRAREEAGATDLRTEQ